MARWIVCWLLMSAAVRADVLPIAAVISDEQEICGSATVIDHCRWPDGDRGFVAVTARHCVRFEGVVARRENVSVEWQGRRLVPVTLICDCGLLDLALLYFVCPGRLPEPVQMAALEPAVDEGVESQGCDEGQVARPDEAVVIASGQQLVFRSRYLTTTGRSGGCVVKGRELVGIVTERSKRDGRVGYAVPVSQVRRYVQQWYPLGNCPGGVCPAPPSPYQFQAGQVPSTSPPYRSTVPAQSQSGRDFVPIVGASSAGRSCPECERRFAAWEARLAALEKRPASDASQQVESLRSELNQLSDRVQDLEESPVVTQAIRDLRADLKRMQELKIPVRVLTPDGRVFSEEQVKLGDPIDFRLVPKTRKPDGGE